MIDMFLNSWPEKEDGVPEDEVFLCNESDIACGADICCSQLIACGIPFITRIPAQGQIGALYTGVSPVGRDIYVPKSFFEDAQEAIQEAEYYAFE